MEALVKLVAYLAPKAAEVLKEGAKQIYDKLVEDEVIE